MMRRLVAATAAVVLLAGCEGSADHPDSGPDPSTSAASGSSSSTSPSEPLETGLDTGPVVECPRSTQKIDPALPDAVPEGATSVRLCDGGADKVTPPADALTTDVASVVAAVNGQPLARKGCVDLRIPEYQLAFGYPDGSRFVVAGRFTRCAELLVGSARRAKAGPPLQTFVESLRAQRSTATPPEQGVVAADLDCAQPETYLPSEVALPTDLAVAVLCVGELHRPGGAGRVTITPEDLAILVSSMGSDTVDTEGMFCPAAVRGRWIVGASAWGDPITMPQGCAGPNLEGSVDWVPRDQARGILRRLTEEAH
jgi:hypothetical protein